MSPPGSECRNVGQDLEPKGKVLGLRIRMLAEEERNHRFAKKNVRAVLHDSNSTFNTYEDLNLAESDRMMSKRPPASTKISILEKTSTTQPTNAMLQQQEQMALHSLPTTTGCLSINIEVFDLFRLKRFPVFVHPESRHFRGLTQAETAVTDVLEAKRKLREDEMMGEGRQE
ncbi:hypothetical protein B0H13DRAFT_1872881 [Mycena leptocephala]|nr:hypothetical protein B0H13DRAFT_1872881 [Mycena leptocephala]